MTKTKGPHKRTISKVSPEPQNDSRDPPELSDILNRLEDSLEGHQIQEKAVVDGVGEVDVLNLTGLPVPSATETAANHGQSVAAEALSAATDSPRRTRSGVRLDNSKVVTRRGRQN